MPVRVASPGHSVALLSRLEVGSFQWHHPWGARRAFLEVAVPFAGLTIFGVHLSAVHSNWTERRRARELRQVLDRSTRIEGLHVLVGDFNTVAPGEVFDVTRLPPRLRALVWLSGGRIRWQIIQMMLEAGYIDGFRLLHPESDGSTFPTGDPHVRLDYLFLPAPFAPCLSACQVVLDGHAAKRASDHYPLLADVQATPGPRGSRAPNGAATFQGST
jgi:endonuclease/exonuclease/phosphatase family metal-dependent hydrolase